MGWSGEVVYRILGVRRWGGGDVEVVGVRRGRGGRAKGYMRVEREEIWGS